MFREMRQMRINVSAKKATKHHKYVKKDINQSTQCTNYRAIHDNTLM
jgi:hypothetical protein